VQMANMQTLIRAVRLSRRTIHILTSIASHQNGKNKTSKPEPKSPHGICFVALNEPKNRYCHFRSFPLLYFFRPQILFCTHMSWFCIFLYSCYFSFGVHTGWVRGGKSSPHPETHPIVIPLTPKCNPWVDGQGITLQG